MTDEDTGAPRKGAKKTAAKKSTARKSPARKPGTKKPRTRKAPAQAEPTVAAEAAQVAREDRQEQAREAAEERSGRIAEEVVDAEIVAETPAEDEPAAALSDEERELASVYGEEMGAPATAHAEYQDRQTRDEDRPMMPEINAREERRHQWQERRDRRKQRREERQQRRDAAQHGHGGPRPSDHRPPEGRPEGRSPHEGRPSQPVVQPTNGHAPDGPARVGTPLGDAAATVFAQLRNGQPLPVRQLAAMMRKRSLVQQDPEQLWPQLKAELLGDERSYRSLGLRPRIVYRGRDLFAPGPVALSATADAEAQVAGALSRLAGATHRALAARLARASAQGFERLIHAYLVAAGYRDIDWIKRVGGISYATALAPGLDRTVLLSARSGDQPIDRRAIGELRVGVEAKDLVSGILFSPSDLSEDAERELERSGRSIAVFCGAQLVAALVQAGVGVVSSAAPLHYVDDQLLDELLAG
jgi:hypothetical protein